MLIGNPRWPSLSDERVYIYLLKDKENKRQTIHRKLTIKQNEPHYKMGMNPDVPDGKAGDQLLPTSKH